MTYDCACDYDPAEFYAARVRMARKEHKCDECAGWIQPGEKYEAVIGKWEGCMGTFKTCEHCVNIRRWTKNNVPCLCWSHGNTIEDCKEAVQEAWWRAPDETRGLRFGLLRRIVLRDRFYQQRRAA